MFGRSYLSVSSSSCLASSDRLCLHLVMLDIRCLKYAALLISSWSLDMLTLSHSWMKKKDVHYLWDALLFELPIKKKKLKKNSFPGREQLKELQNQRLVFITGKCDQTQNDSTSWRVISTSVGKRTSPIGSSFVCLCGCVALCAAAHVWTAALQRLFSLK